MDRPRAQAVSSQSVAGTIRDVSLTAGGVLGSDLAGNHQPLTFSDVISELHRIADLARRLDEAGGSEIASACFRTESLLTRLRNQFLEELLSDGGGLGPTVA